LEEVIIRSGVPLCSKCMSVLEYGKIRPRNIEGAKTKKKRVKKKRGGKKE